MKSRAISHASVSSERKASQRLIALLMAGSALTLPVSALAQAISWDGDVGTDWADAANWSGDTLPGNADNVTIDVASIAVQPTVLTPQTVARTDIVKGTLTVSSTLTSAEVRLPNFLGFVRDPDLDNLQGHLVVTAGGSIVGTVRVGGFEFSGVATRMEGPVSLSPASGISVTSGGIAEFTNLSLGNGGVDRSGSVIVSGAGSRLSAGTFEADGASHTILVSAGGRLSTNQAGLSRGTATVTGAGSVWDIAATSNNNTNFGIFTPIALDVLDGGRINSLNPSSMQIGGSSNVRIAGAGSAIELASSITIGGTNGSQPAGSFVIEDGASLIVHSPNGSSLGFSQRGEVIIRNGGSWIQDGGLNAGVQINSANLLIDGGTFSASGIVSFDQLSDTILRLRNASFTARELDAAKLVEIGASSGNPAASAGTFDVGVVLLRGGKQLILNHTEQNYVIGSEFRGDPTSLISQLAGDTIFTGANGGYAGEFNITGGAVRFNGSFGNAGARATVDSEGGLATVGGSGTFGGTLSVLNGTLAPGNSPGTLTIGSDLVLGANALVSFELGAPDGVAGVASDLVNVNGNLTLDGRLDVIDAGGFGAGLYRLFNYGGTLTDNGLDLGTLPTGYAISDMSIQTAQANQVNLIVSAPTVPTSFTFWDGGDVDGNGFIDGGNGTWTVADSNWTTSDGVSNGAFRPEDFLIFSAATEAPQARFALAAAVVAPSSSAGTVTVDDTAGVVTLANGVQFATDGYTVTGDAIELAATIPCGECTPLPGSVIMRVGDGSSAGADFVATIQSQLTGAAGLEKTDLGTLILQGANTYAGGTRISDGVLQIAADNALGAAEGAVTFNGGTLRITAAMTSARGISVENGGGTLDSGANAITLSGTIGGTGNLTLNGSGLRTISDDSSEFAGSTTLTAGTLALPGSLGGLLTVAAPATLTGTGTSGSLDLSGTISPGATNGSTGTFNVSGDVTIRAGSTLNVDVAASGAGDRISAGGHALIEGGTVAVTALDPAQSYTNGTVYRIVNASGGLTGTFTGLTETSAFLDFALGYDPTGAFLTTTVNAQFPDVARTFNQRQASGALKNFETTAGSDALNVYNAILVQDADHARAAFDAASGEIYPTLLASRQRAGLELVERITMRGRADGNEGLAMWGGVLGDRGHVDSDGNGARSTANSFGWESGLDYRGPDNRWAVGFGGGWQEGDVTLTARGSSAKTDAWHIGGYVRYGSGAKGFSAMAGAVHADANASVTRQIGFGTIARTASSRVDLRTTAANLELRYGLGSAKLAVGPVVSIDHASTKLGRVAETGAAALNLTGTGKRESWTRYGVGGFARYDLGKGFADLSLRYVNRDRGDTEVNLAMAGSPTSYAVRAAGGSRGAARLDASTELSIGRRWTISGNLGAILAQSEGQVDGSIRLSYRF